MPRYEDVIGSFMKDRDDGEPTRPTVPGGDLGTSQPSGPNPPSLNKGFPGRPKDPPMAAGAGPLESSGQERDAETVAAQKQPELQRLRMILGKVPSRAERLDLPPDVDIETPYGLLGADGEIAFTPDGEQKYKEQIVHARKKFGAHPFADDPNAPQFDVKLGNQFFNPFTGSFGRY